MAIRVSSVLSKVSILLFAVLLSQFPAYENSYEQRLSGHVDELRYHIDSMKETARQSGKTLDEFIAKFQASQDPDFHRQGVLMNGMQTRLIRLESALYNLDSATLFSKPFLFMIHFDKAIAKATLKKYHFALPLTFEGVCWAVIGAFIGYFFFRFSMKVSKVLFRKEKVTKAV
ncbi:DUF2937 family protein [Estrella lausannensis]|uniref:Conserved putative membrane protein n=1 Tax=Estrella lausannensis TaxID=483423 RepID=A0A0H5E4E5_9BACT|nr:DUF2937 family protein [Estrella lausannensis]CRX38075.1 Conserved putative membrane protein [Estrella lausannensis]